MQHVTTVFDRVEYRERLSGEPWDVLWSHQYPFGNPKLNLTHLLPHQKVRPAVSRNSSHADVVYLVYMNTTSFPWHCAR